MKKTTKKNHLKTIRSIEGASKPRNQSKHWLDINFLPILTQFYFLFFKNRTVWGILYNIYLQVLFSVKDDGFGFDLPVLDVHLIAAEHDRNVLTDTHQVTMPVGNVFVCHSGGHVKHDDGAVSWGKVSHISIVSTTHPRCRIGSADVLTCGCLFVPAITVCVIHYIRLVLLFVKHVKRGKPTLPG